MRPPEMLDAHEGSPFDAGEALAEAIEHAITAGACRRAGVLNPDQRMTWNAVAEARRRDAINALRRWAIARLDEG